MDDQASHQESVHQHSTTVSFQKGHDESKAKEHDNVKILKNCRIKYTRQKYRLYDVNGKDTVNLLSTEYQWVHI